MPKKIKYSVIIPTLNQSNKLRLCLSYISKLDFEQELFEVIVVDNGSTDDTKKVALSFSDKIKSLKYVFCESPGLMAARHKGFEEARGEILCFIDDDSMVTNTWLKGIDRALRDESVVLVGGPCIPKYESKPPEWVGYFWKKRKYGKVHPFLSLIDFGEKRIVINPLDVFGCNYSIRKKTFLELGGTNPDYLPEKYSEYQGDGESGLSRKILEANYKAIYEPEAKIYHLIPNSRLTVDYFCRRAYFNGIHSSYTEIRMKNMAKSNDACNFLSIAKRKLRKYKDSLIYLFKPKKNRTIIRKIKMSYWRGFNFHQQAVNKNPKLLEWILRDNYLGKNGELPI